MPVPKWIPGPMGSLDQPSLPFKTETAHLPKGPRYQRFTAVLDLDQKWTEKKGAKDLEWF